MHLTRRTWLASAALAPLAGGLAAWFTERRGWREVSPRERFRQHHFPAELEVVTHEGRRVRFYEDLVADKKVVINFMYAHCKGICLPVTRNLVRVQELLAPRVGQDIFFYSISLEP